MLKGWPPSPSSCPRPARAAGFAIRTTRSRSPRWAGGPCGCTRPSGFSIGQDVKQVIVVIDDEDREDFSRMFGANIAIMGVEVCAGGAERADSVQNALAKVRDDIDFVAVHDAARPCLADKWIDAVFAAAEKTGAAILAVARVRHAQAGRRQGAAGDRRDGRPHEAVGSANAAGVPPRPAQQGLRRPRRRQRDGRCAARRKAGRPRHAGRRLADEHQDHDQGRPAAGRANPEGAAQGRSRKDSRTRSPATTCGGERRLGPHDAHICRVGPRRVPFCHGASSRGSPSNPTRQRRTSNSRDR